MRQEKLFGISFTLSFLGLIITSYNIEGKSLSSLGMYLVNYFFPIIISSFIYCAFILILEFIKIVHLKIILSFIPIIAIFIISISGIDSQNSFFLKLESICLGVTNIIWSYNILSKKT